MKNIFCVMVLFNLFVYTTIAQIPINNSKSFQSQNNNISSNVFSKSKSLEIDSLIAAMMVFKENLNKSVKVLEDTYIKTDGNLFPFNDLKTLENINWTLGNIKQYIAENTDSISKVDSLPNKNKYVFYHHIVGEPLSNLVTMSLDNATMNIKDMLNYIRQNHSSLTKKQQSTIKSLSIDIEMTYTISVNVFNKYNNLYKVRPELIQNNTNNNFGF